MVDSDSDGDLAAFVAPPSPEGAPPLPSEAPSARLVGHVFPQQNGFGALSASTFIGEGPRGRQVVRHLGTIRWYNGRRQLGKVIPDSGGDDLFIPMRGAVNGSQVPPQPGGLFHGTRVSFLPVRLSTGESATPANLRDKSIREDVVCMDVRPVPGQVGLSVGVDTDNGAKEQQDDRIAAADLHELGFFCGVFDGHRGFECADFLARALPGSVLAEYRKRVKCYGKKGLTGLSEKDEASLISQAIEDAFESTDQAFLQAAAKKGLMDGSTAVVSLMCHGFEIAEKVAIPEAYDPLAAPVASPEQIPGSVASAPQGVARLFIAWCGDSRAVLLRGRKGMRLTEDHRPTRTDEQQRVVRAGGRVVQDAWGIFRVGPKEDNKLAIELQRSKKREPGAMKWYLSTSRAFGDPELKSPNPIVISTPDTRVVDLVPEDWAVVLGCDGIFDYMSDQQVADVVWKSMAARGEDCIMASKAVVQAALRSGSKDNLTAIVMRLGWASPPGATLGDTVAASAATATAASDELNMFS